MEAFIHDEVFDFEVIICVLFLDTDRRKTIEKSALWLFES